MGEGWKVTGQSEQQTVGVVPGRFETQVRVDYSTDEGIVGSVVVSMADYTPDKVAALIEEAVGKHRAIRAL